MYVSFVKNKSNPKNVSPEHIVIAFRCLKKEIECIVLVKEETCNKKRENIPDILTNPELRSKEGYNINQHNICNLSY